MLSTRHRVQVYAALAGAASALLAGCASGTDKAEKTADKAGESATAAAPSAAGAPGNPVIGVSPGGVTTRVDEPAQSTEEQYAQSCLATKAWMDAKGGDAKALVEPFLKELQTSTESGPATFNRTWSDLSAAQQAAVIIAVEAAADGGC